MRKGIYRTDKMWKMFLLVFAALIFIFSIIYTKITMRDLRKEEHKRMDLWSQAMQDFINSDPTTDISFQFEVIENNKNIPVILVDADNKTIISYRNIDSVRMEKPAYCEKILNEFRDNDLQSFQIKSPDGEVLNTIYYSDSLLLKKMHYYPYVQLLLIAIFLVMAYIVFNVSRRA